MRVVKNKLNYQSINQLIQLIDKSQNKLRIYLMSDSPVYCSEELTVINHEELNISEDKEVKMDEYLYFIPYSNQRKTLVIGKDVIISKHTQNELGSIYYANSINIMDIHSFDYVILDKYSELLSQIDVKQIILNDGNNLYYQNKRTIYTNNINMVSLPDRVRNHEINYRVQKFENEELTFKTLTKLIDYEKIIDIFIKEKNTNGEVVIHRDVKIENKIMKTKLKLNQIEEIECTIYYDNRKVFGKIKLIASERLFQTI